MFAGAQVVVEAEAEPWVPAFVQTFSPAFDPGPDHRPFFLRGADDFGHVEQSLVRPNQDRARQDVLGQKRARPVKNGVVATGMLDDLDQPDKAVVLVARRPLGGVWDVIQVEALVVGYLSDLDPLQRRGPAWGVVRATLPGMVDGHESRAFRVAGGRQVAVPRKELGVDLAEEFPGFGDPLAPSLGDREYAPRRDCVYRWLAQAAGKGRTGRGVRGIGGARPVLGTREVALGGRSVVEDDVRYLPVLPLVLEEGPDLTGGASRVEVGQPDGYKGCVPTPLVRVERGGGAGPLAHIVLPQHLSSPRGDVFRSQTDSFRLWSCYPTLRMAGLSATLSRRSTRE